MSKEKSTGLARLREPFEPHQISKLPKPTKKQTDDLKSDRSLGIRCEQCGGWHHKDVIHLDYVGHAALTDRLLDADLNWNWEPLAFDALGLPQLDKSGGLWIKLTVCGHTRLGYGNAGSSENKDPGSREKELIGDALRNAAMRFGAALDLWHKGELHPKEESFTQEDSLKQEIPKKIINHAPQKEAQQHFPVTARTAYELLEYLNRIATEKKLDEHQYKQAIKRVIGTEKEDVELSAEELKRVIVYINAFKVKK